MCANQTGLGQAVTVTPAQHATLSWPASLNSTFKVIPVSLMLHITCKIPSMVGNMYIKCIYMLLVVCQCNAYVIRHVIYCYIMCLNISTLRHPPSSFPHIAVYLLPRPEPLYFVWQFNVQIHIYIMYKPKYVIVDRCTIASLHVYIVDDQTQ